MSKEEEQVLLYQYQCVRCGAIVKSTDLELGIRCPYCRYRVLKKIRPPVVKRILAR
ncbi:MAG: DNA-directed RNA polymerase subunit P [Thermoproteota archaeon]